MEQSNKIQRSETWNNIYEVLARLDLKENVGDGLDRPSAAVEIEELFLKLLALQNVRLSLPDENELNALRSQYRASGGDAGWIQDAYKNGFIDGWNNKRTDIHLRKPTYKPKPKGNEA